MAQIRLALLCCCYSNNEGQGFVILQLILSMHIVKIVPSLSRCQNIFFGPCTEVFTHFSISRVQLIVRTNTVDITIANFLY